jgi:membrane complex biogenesis BtpA family protein
VDFAGLFRRKPLLGMIHLPALLGAPRSTHTIEQLEAYAMDEAAKHARAGLDGVIMENLGDAPFPKTQAEPVTIAAMATLVRSVVRHTNLAVGVNVLRNACESALAIAHVAGADFIRCNVVIGAYATDQGIIEGCAAPLARLRQALRADVLVFGDVHVKHAHPLYDVPIEDAAADLAERGGVDAIIVSGARSPVPPSLDRVRHVKASVSLPILIGSGVTIANAVDLLRLSDGLIIGEAPFKVGRQLGGPSDESAYARLVRLLRPAALPARPAQRSRGP